MKQFSSPRTAWFYGHSPRIRHIALPVFAIVCVYAFLSFFSAPQPPAAAAQVAAAPVPPAPDIVEYSTTLPAEQAAPATASAQVSSKITALQEGIGHILKASNELLVSEKKVVIGKGDTLMDILVRNNVPRTEAYEAIQALSKVYNPRDLNPRHEITVFFHQDPAVADPKFSGLEIERDPVNTVRVNRAEDGRYTADQQEREVQRTLRGFSGKIDSSLYVSAKAHNVPDSVILSLIKMYSWSVDFQRDIQSGDTFDVMYEEYATEDGRVVPGRGEIVYAKLTLGDRSIPLYLYTDSSGDTNYYDDKGQSAKRPLMKTPVDGARLSSGFGMRRHPVLGYSKMHKGVDFAAPRGTPIYAAGDGVIEKMGPFSTYGNYVRIRHRAGLKTVYAHLHGFKAGLRGGSRIKQGQVIGYVGKTGRSTGPHLHYEILLNGAQVNPAAVKLPTGEALKGKDLKAFQVSVAENDRVFQSLGRNSAVASLNKTASFNRN